MSSKCSFRNCDQRRHIEKLRYFHYPIRDRARCLQWIANAQRLDFNALPIETLRNKVICAVHFETKFFMNDRKVRLTHNAVPTLDHLGNDASVDVKTFLERSEASTSKEVLNSKVEIKIPPNTPDLSLVSVDGDTFRISELPAPPTEPDVVLDIPMVVPVALIKRKIDASESTPKRRAVSYERKMESPIKRIQSTQSPEFDLSRVKVENTNKLTYVVSENGDLNLLTTSDSPDQTTLLNNNITLKQKSNNESGPVTYSICVDAELEESFKKPASPVTSTPIIQRIYKQPSRTYDDMKNVEITIVQDQSDIEENFMEDSSNNLSYSTQTEEITISTDQLEYSPLDESNNVLTHNVNQQTDDNRFKKDRRSQPRNHILFKQLSRSINPMLASLLKMELFGRSSARESAIKLYDSTPEGYEALIEHWGFKLPPVNVVKQWLLESK